MNAVGVYCICEGGKLLKLPRTSISMSLIYFHKLNKDMGELTKNLNFDEVMVIICCLLLASKMTDNVRRLRDIINIVRKLAFPDLPPLSIVSNEYQDYKSLIIELELIVMRFLNFDLDVELPYRHLMNYVAYFGETEGFAQLCIDILNDSFKSRRCIGYSISGWVLSVISIAKKLFHQKYLANEKNIRDSSDDDDDDDDDENNNHNHNNHKVDDYKKSRHKSSRTSQVNYRRIIRFNNNNNKDKDKDKGLEITEDDISYNLRRKFVEDEEENTFAGESLNRIMQITQEILEDNPNIVKLIFIR